MGNDISSDDGSIMPRGSISGYAYAVITHTNNFINIPCQSSIGKNEVSGMGITVQTRCSTPGIMLGVHGHPISGKASYFDDSMTTNDTIYPGGTHEGCTMYRIYFTMPADCPSFEVFVWIYG